jgi:hypothetical protein
VTLKTALFILIAACSVRLRGQDTDQWYRENRTPVAMLNVAVDMGISSGQFAQNMNNRAAAGSNVELLIRLKKRQPVWAGLGYRAFAWDADEIVYTQQIDNEFYNYEERTVSRIAQVHGLLRFQPEVRWILQPYVQGAAGINWFYTNTRIIDVDYGETVDRINENRDLVPGFALQAGVEFGPRKIPELRFDVRIGYLNNASVEYLRYDPRLDFGNFPIESFETKISSVEIVTVEFGIALMMQTPGEVEED